MTSLLINIHIIHFILEYPAKSSKCIDCLKKFVFNILTSKLSKKHLHPSIQKQFIQKIKWLKMKFKNLANAPVKFVS